MADITVEAKLNKEGVATQYGMLKLVYSLGTITVNNNQASCDITWKVYAKRDTYGPSLSKACSFWIKVGNTTIGQRSFTIDSIGTSYITIASGTHTITYPASSEYSGAIQVYCNINTSRLYNLRLPVKEYTAQYSGSKGSYVTGSANSLKITLPAQYTAPTAPTSITIVGSDSSTKLLSQSTETITITWSGAKEGTLNPITKYSIYGLVSTYGDKPSVSNKTFSIEIDDPSATNATYTFPETLKAGQKLVIGIIAVGSEPSSGTRKDSIMTYSTAIMVNIPPTLSFSGTEYIYRDVAEITGNITSSSDSFIKFKYNNGTEENFTGNPFQFTHGEGIYTFYAKDELEEKSNEIEFRLIQDGIPEIISIQATDVISPISGLSNSYTNFKIEIKTNKKGIATYGIKYDNTITEIGTILLENLEDNTDDTYVATTELISIYDYIPIPGMQYNAYVGFSDYVSSTEDETLPSSGYYTLPIPTLLSTGGKQSWQYDDDDGYFAYIDSEYFYNRIKFSCVYDSDIDTTDLNKFKVTYKNGQSQINATILNVSSYPSATIPSIDIEVSTDSNLNANIYDFIIELPVKNRTFSKIITTKMTQISRISFSSISLGYSGNNGVYKVFNSGNNPREIICQYTAQVIMNSSIAASFGFSTDPTKINYYIPKAFIEIGNKRREINIFSGASTGWGAGVATYTDITDFNNLLKLSAIENKFSIDSTEQMADFFDLLPKDFYGIKDANIVVELINSFGLKSNIKATIKLDLDYEPKISFNNRTASNINNYYEKNKVVSSFTVKSKQPLQSTIKTSLLSNVKFTNIFTSSEGLFLYLDTSNSTNEASYSLDDGFIVPEITKANKSNLKYHIEYILGDNGTSNSPYSRTFINDTVFDTLNFKISYLEVPQITVNKITYVVKNTNDKVIKLELKCNSKWIDDNFDINNIDEQVIYINELENKVDITYSNEILSKEIDYTMSQTRETVHLYASYKYKLLDKVTTDNPPQNIWETKRVDLGTFTIYDLAPRVSLRNGTTGIFTKPIKNDSILEIAGINGRTKVYFGEERDIYIDASTGEFNGSIVNAINAQKLVDSSKQSLNVGSNSLPVYFSNGVPIQCTSISVSNLTGGANTIPWQSGVNTTSYLQINNGALYKIDNSNIQFNTLPISCGGTGATTAAAALSNIGAAPTSHTHSTSEVGIYYGAEQPINWENGDIWLQPIQ